MYCMPGKKNGGTGNGTLIFILCAAAAGLLILALLPNWVLYTAAALCLLAAAALALLKCPR